MTDRENETTTPSPAPGKEAQPDEDGPSRAGIDHHATNTGDHTAGSPDCPPEPPQTISAPRRLTITIAGDEAEACQFTNGAIMAHWREADMLYAWRSLDDLRHQWPDALVIWIDRDRAASSDAGPVKRFRLREPIEAVRWTGENEAELRAFCGDGFQVIDPEYRGDDPEAKAAVLTRFSAWVPVRDGQWVVRDRDGGFYRLDHADLVAEYEAAPGSEAAPASASVFVAEAVWFENNPVDGRERIAVRATLDDALTALRDHGIYGGDLVATETTSGSELGTDTARTWAVHERNEKPSDEGLLWITEEQIRPREEAPNA